MFSIMTSQDRSALNSRRNWIIGAWVMSILFLTAATPALANDNGGPNRGGYKQVSRSAHTHGKGNYQSRTKRQFDRGLQAGVMNGRQAGFNDGRFGNGYWPRPSLAYQARSKYFQKGYRRGYKMAYEKAFHRGQDERQHQLRHQRQHQRQHLRGRWSWRFDW